MVAARNTCWLGYCVLDMCMRCMLLLNGKNLLCVECAKFVCAPTQQPLRFKRHQCQNLFCERSRNYQLQQKQQKHIASERKGAQLHTKTKKQTEVLQPQTSRQHTQTATQTATQARRQTGTQQTQRQRNKQAHRQAHSRHTDRHTSRHTDNHTNSHSKPPFASMAHRLYLRKVPAQWTVWEVTDWSKSKTTCKGKTTSKSQTTSSKETSSGWSCSWWELWHWLEAPGSSWCPDQNSSWHCMLSYCFFLWHGYFVDKILLASFIACMFCELDVVTVLRNAACTS